MTTLTYIGLCRRYVRRGGLRHGGVGRVRWCRRGGHQRRDVGDAVCDDDRRSWCRFVDSVSDVALVLRRVAGFFVVIRAEVYFEVDLAVYIDMFMRACRTKRVNGFELLY